MEAIKISYADPRVKRIIQDCFPSYRGRKIRVDSHIPSEINSYWDGGSKDSFCWYQPSTRKVFHVHTNHPFFEANQPRNINAETIPADVLLIEHSIFCGKDVGITIHVPSQSTNLLPLNSVKLE